MKTVTRNDVAQMNMATIAALDAACETLHNHQMLAVTSLPPVAAVETILRLQQIMRPLRSQLNSLMADPDNSTGN